MLTIRDYKIKLKLKTLKLNLYRPCCLLNGVTLFVDCCLCQFDSNAKIINLNIR
jgi:hypothetical protein